MVARKPIGNLQLASLVVLLLAIVAFLAHTTAGQEQETLNEGASQISIEAPASLNLKSILEHQEGLERECAKYREKTILKLEHLAKYGDENEQTIHLPKPLPVKVPAVCLFLFSQFGRLTSNDDNDDDKLDQNHDQASGVGSKLELVNWIYGEPEDLLANLKHNDNVSKRDITQPDQLFLADHLFDPNAIDYPLNGELSNDTIKFHDDVETMLADKRFGQVINSNRQRISGHLSPIILVPGLLGSRLQARTNKKRSVNFLCSKQNDWQDLWLSIRQLLPFVVDCWLDNVRLEFDPQTGFSKSPMGVESRVADFGSVESVRHLDLNQPKVSSYFEPLIKRYEQLGYIADENLLAAPYDFRLAPQELGDYFSALKKLVEQSQTNSPSNKKVTFVCHSMGCTQLLVFLRLQSAAWRQSRVRKMIALSSPWAGAIKALKALVVGDQLSLPIVSETKMRNIARTYPSIAFLLPHPDIFNRTNQRRATPGGPVLVQTPLKTYKAVDLEQLLRDLKLEKQLNWFHQTASLIKPREPLPDLHIDCIHSLNTPTPETLIFRNQSDFPNGDYEQIKGDGDGTVNSESLLICDDWATMLPDKVKHTVIMNTDHTGVLSHKTTLTHITDDVLV